MGILPSPHDNRNKNICVFYNHHTIIEIKIYVYFTIAARLKGMNNVGPFLT
jgi:hypothetical protein